MNVSQFVQKWGRTKLSERSASQQHFCDLCGLFDHPKPADIDATGESFTFEKGATKPDGSDGWADVWKKGFFGWEYKRKHADLDEAVFAAYGWDPEIDDEQILEKLLALNKERSDRG